MKKHIYPVLLMLVLCILGVTALAKSQSPLPMAVPAPSAHTTQSQSISAAQVGTHNSAQSCWTSISGNVYDLTPWITQHPGGSGAILSLCGVDGTNAFMAQHGGQGRPERELATFKIGVLSN